MDFLPTDPTMLLSSIIMLLRDEEFDTLESLCSYFDREVSEVLQTLLDEGYEYDEKNRHFRPILNS